MTGTVPAAQVSDLLAAIRAASSPADIDQAAMMRRLDVIRSEIDGILAAFAVGARRPDLPSMVPDVMAAATRRLHEFAGEGESK